MNLSDHFQPTVLTTADGSSTLKHGVFGELYHSRHGAWTESQHIFIEHGLLAVKNQELDAIYVFEMGFGSGLNAALSREIAEKNQMLVHYTAVELYPVQNDVIEAMRMPGQSQAARRRWLELHQIPWETKVSVSDWFTIHKINASFPEEIVAESGKFDLVYYDAFAPAAQPDLWKREALGWCYELLGEGGLWLSYCAKGMVRRTLKEVGFEVEALPGPPGKREITRAVKRFRIVDL